MSLLVMGNHEREEGWNLAELGAALLLIGGTLSLLRRRRAARHLDGGP